MDFRVLALNPGSATLKFGLYSVSMSGVKPRVLAEATGLVDRLGTPECELRLEFEGVPATIRTISPKSAAEATNLVIDELISRGGAHIDAVGCRVVHGGDHFR